MRKIFADLVYWIALINPTDQWFERSHSVTENLSGFQIITTNEVITETLNFYAERGLSKRAAALSLTHSILLNVKIEVVASTPESFHNGIELYESRPDKGYSLTDCISMNVVRGRGILEILTHDAHFAQEGFEILL